MRKLMMTTAMVVPLLAVPAYAQQNATQPEEDAAMEPQVEMQTEEPQVEVETEEPNVEITQEEPQVEVVQEPPTVEVIEGGEEPAAAEAPAATAQPQTETAEQPAGPPPEAVVTEMGPDELRGDWVIGTTVVSPEDEDIGQIQDVIITADGQISAAVLSVGGFLGLGAKNIAVDWSELQIAQDGQEITLDLTRDEAESAPEYAFREQEQPEGEAGTATQPAAQPMAEPAAEQEAQ